MIVLSWWCDLSG
ncbi:hypothetical protein OIU77_006193 [Salix suchowensis]|uniref:Uncharacterized protein n=1 Tax=Salix suchowensis TaxID=1278906 RepID=A0ABQ9AK41_9ROSI|nr:hypothetical protein OIU77_006193 [Salix suchowensis]